MAVWPLLLLQGFLWSQMPQSPGRLAVKSEPPDAAVTIDNQVMKKHTPSTFVVSPGKHNLKVAGQGLNCSVAQVNVPSGSTVTVNCTTAGPTISKAN
jgi:hypothetical protein